MYVCVYVCMYVRLHVCMHVHIRPKSNFILIFWNSNNMCIDAFSSVDYASTSPDRTCNLCCMQYVYRCNSPYQMFSSSHSRVTAMSFGRIPGTFPPVHSMCLPNACKHIQLVQIFPAFYDTCSVFTRQLYLSLSWATQIRPILSQPSPLRYILILYFHLSLRLSDNFWLSIFLSNFLKYVSYLPGIINSLLCNISKDGDFMVGSC
jgi:hypothetical protein